MIGGSAFTLSSASADDQSDRPAEDATTRVDAADVRLVSRCVDEKRDAALFCAVNEGDEPVTLEWQQAPSNGETEGTIEFVDCQTIRVVGEFAEVGVDATFIAEDGEIGNVIEFFGSVEGERTIDISESADVPDGAIVNRADAFREDTPVVPGGGDVSASNPEYDACREEFFEEGGEGDGSNDEDDGSNGEDDGSNGEEDEYIEFVDCQTVRVVGEFVDVGIDATFVTDAGIGNVIEFFGPVEGERTIDITESETVPDDSIAASVDAFEEGTPIVPGGGDVSRGNPEYDACQEEIFGEIVDGSSDSVSDENTAADDSTGEDASTDETMPTDEMASITEAGERSDETNGRNEITVPAKGKTCFPVSATDGQTTVELFYEGERIDTKSSATDRSCLLPIFPGLFDTVTITTRL